MTRSETPHGDAADEPDDTREIRLPNDADDPAAEGADLGYGSSEDPDAEAAPYADDDTRPRRRIEVDDDSDADLGYTEIDPNETTGEVAPVTGHLSLDFSAVSDVGRVRKDNQDSGYAGPHLLAVCDGVGGAARGDIASSTAISQLSRLDEAPTDDLLGHVAGGLLRAHNKIGEIVDEDPALNGTSTTATLALFDGEQIGLAHVGDSRAYLLRGGELTQLTKDHTFVQSLIDEGRITEEEARTHPHRNLILKALDGVHETDPDLFTVELAAGDRLFLCSDGACGVLSDPEITELLSQGTPDSAAVELVQASLEAGSTDNVTCVVADVTTSAPSHSEPLLVGAAAELPRKGTGRTGLFRHRDTGEMEPITAEIPPDVDFAIPTDPEEQRYRPLPPRRFLWLRRVFTLLIIVGVLAAILGAGYAWTQQRYFVKADDEDRVRVFRGFDYSVLGFDLYSPVEDSGLTVDDVADIDQALADRVTDGLEYEDSAQAARDDFDERLGAASAADEESNPSGEDSTDPSAEPSSEPSSQPSSAEGSGASDDMESEKPSTAPSDGVGTL